MGKNRHKKHPLWKRLLAEADGKRKREAGQPRLCGNSPKHSLLNQSAESVEPLKPEPESRWIGGRQCKTNSCSELPRDFASGLRVSTFDEEILVERPVGRWDFLAHSELFSERSIREECDSAGMKIFSIRPLRLSDSVASNFAQCHRRLASSGVSDLRIVRRFHGTHFKARSGIEAHGLVVPGTFSVGVANGSALGNGIYLAQRASTSVSYCRVDGPCQRHLMLVCAVLCTRDLYANKCMLHNNNGVTVSFRREFVLPYLAIEFARETGSHRCKQSLASAVIRRTDKRRASRGCLLLMAGIAMCWVLNAYWLNATT